MTESSDWRYVAQSPEHTVRGRRPLTGWLQRAVNNGRNIDRPAEVPAMTSSHGYDRRAITRLPRQDRQPIVDDVDDDDDESISAGGFEAVAYPAAAVGARQPRSRELLPPSPRWRSPQQHQQQQQRRTGGGDFRRPVVVAPPAGGRYTQQNGVGIRPMTSAIGRGYDQVRRAISRGTVVSEVGLRSDSSQSMGSYMMWHYVFDEGSRLRFLMGDTNSTIYKYISLYITHYIFLHH